MLTPNHSFVLVPEDPDAEMEDSDEMRMLAADFEIGHMLRDSIVPKAVLYYTGEVADEDDGEVRRSFLEQNYPIYSTLCLPFV